MSSIYHIVNVEGAIVRDGYYLLVVRGHGESHAAGLLSLVGEGGRCWRYGQYP